MQQQRKLHVQEKDGRQQKQQLVQLLQDAVDEDEQLQKVEALRDAQHQSEDAQHQSEDAQHQSEDVQHQSEDVQALKEDVDKLPIPSFFNFFLDYLLL